MKYLITTIAAILLIGCGESQQSHTSTETKPVEPVAEVPEQQSSFEVESVLQSATAKIDPQSSIQDAAKKGDLQAVKNHLASGVDVNDDGGIGMTALQNAAGFGHIDVVQLLIKNGADVNTRNPFNLTPIDQANMLNFTETIEILRKHGGKTGAELWADESIVGAAALGDVELLRKYFSNGVDVNEKDDSGETALHYAATEKVADLLISKGAQVNATNDFGETPLDQAEGEVADLLRKHGGKTGEELGAKSN